MPLPGGTNKGNVSGLQFSGCNGSTKGNQTTPPFDIKSYYSYTLDPTDQVKNIVTAGVGPNAAIGDQYTGNTAIVTDRSRYSTPPLLGVTSGASNTLRIRAAFQGEFNLVVSAANGRAINRFGASSSSTFNCAIPGPGLYIVTIIEDRTNRAVRSVLRAVY